MQISSFLSINVKIWAVIGGVVIVGGSLTGFLVWYYVGGGPGTPPGPVEEVYQEAPMLEELVDEGLLPPVEERLPVNPMIVQPHDEVGIYGGTWRMGIVGVASGLLRTTTQYENLLRWDTEFSRIIPNIAQSYDVSEDSREFTFHLRKGLRWSDGVNFTADDIVFWYEADFLNTEIHSSYSSKYTQNGVPAIVEKADNYKVILRFSEPNGIFPFYLAEMVGDWITNRPMHYMKQFHQDYNPEIEDLIEEAGVENWVKLWKSKASEWNNPDMPTVNPWILTDHYNVNSTYVLLERNPYYWKIDTEYNQLPYIDRVNFTIYSTTEELKLAALAGQIDMQHELSIIPYYDEYVANMEEGKYDLLTLINTNSNDLAIHLNIVHEDPILRAVFSNKTFRMALSHAINRTEIIEQVYGLDLEPMQPAPRRESPYYRNLLATQYTEFNPTYANELLDTAGYNERDTEGYRLTPEGQRINFTITVTSHWDYDPLNGSLMLVEYWDELDIIVNVEDLSRGDRDYKITGLNQHDVTVHGSKGGYYVVREAGIYIPFDKYNSFFAIPWAYWYKNSSDIRAEEPSSAAQEQMLLYNQISASNSTEEIATLMNQILVIAEEEFYIMGICSPPDLYFIKKTNFLNVPLVIPRSWAYATPGPTNPCQYYIEQQNESQEVPKASINNKQPNGVVNQNSKNPQDYLICSVVRRFR